MKKIAIITLNGYFNYGNRLQNYALTKTLKDFNLIVVNEWFMSKKERIKHLIIYKTPIRHLSKKRDKLYIFTRKYLSPKLAKKDRALDYTIIGSDQVWNPNIITQNQYLLMPYHKDSKLLSYAASMGVQQIDQHQEQVFKKYLRYYSNISVREHSAKKILQPFVNKAIEVVLDPTLLLNKADYDLLEKKPKDVKEDEKYILCYILGNRDHEDLIRKFANKKGYRVIVFSDKKGSAYGIEEFLYLVHHARLICTDSFHACVFSFIFERPFIAFKRTGKENYMYTRLQNLIETFKLKNREFNGKEITKENLEVDYTEAKKILKKEQKKSLNFLKRALEIGNEK